MVGAGAAGLATAIFARRVNPARSVALLEGAKKPGAKILVSGGSRCNVTNACVADTDFWGGRRSVVRRVLRAFPSLDTVSFFRDIGVTLHEEAGGKLFPDTNRSRDVLDALLRETALAGATLESGCRVLDVTPSGGGFTVTTSTGVVHASAVVLATGGQSLPKSGSDGAGFAIAKRLGHTIVEPTPALAPLLLNEEEIHRELSGVSQEVELAVWIDGAVDIRLRGALLWTHFGVSGPAAMNASRHWLRAQIGLRDVAITVNFRPGQRFDEVDAEWTRLAAAQPRTSVQTMLGTMMPASAAAVLLRRLAINGASALAHFSRDDRRRLSRALVEWPLRLTGTRGYNYAEATAGGVALTEIDPSTMQSRVCAGLYLVGELLDVDGRIGGFNFQWAWSSGYVAGRAIAGRH
ncbi:MAG TPA: aminoacetone oxidase family FAD-binding enzyme [Vicinamibacterales bacterium]|nr:aminoacetone oxidase family FAD-binding enzyme [Vicinamibacterales bacterium]